jgi:hypothetical protein
MALEERRRVGPKAYEYRDIPARERVPMQGPLASPVMLASGWQKRPGEMTHTPYPYGDLRGDPSLMSPSKDWLFKNAGPVALTRSEAAAFMERQLEDRRQRRESAAYGSTISDEDAREFGGSQSERLARRPMTWRQRGARALSGARGAFRGVAANPGAVGLGLGLVGSAIESYANDENSTMGRIGTFTTSVGTGAVAGAGIGSMFGPAGTAIGGFIGAIGGAAVGLFRIVAASQAAEDAFMAFSADMENQRVSGAMARSESARAGMSPTEQIAALLKEKAGVGVFSDTSQSVGASGEDTKRRDAIDARIKEITFSSLARCTGRWLVVTAPGDDQGVPRPVRSGS